MWATVTSLTPPLQSAAVVVLLRLIKCLFTSAFKRRIDPLGEGLVTMRVWPNDLDLNFHANSGRFVSFMDIGRVGYACAQAKRETAERAALPAAR